MKYNAGKYDIAVIGAGHAGCEAALAPARLGLKTLLITQNIDLILSRERSGDSPVPHCKPINCAL